MSNMGRCGQHGCAFSVRLVNGQRDEYCPECEIDRLRAALATAQAERDRAHQSALDWKATWEQTQDALTEARRVLREVEHVACKLEGECPYCGQLKERGHEPGCALAAVLAQEEK